MGIYRRGKDIDSSATPKSGSYAGSQVQMFHVEHLSVRNYGVRSYGGVDSAWPPCRSFRNESLKERP